MPYIFILGQMEAHLRKFMLTDDLILAVQPKMITIWFEIIKTLYENKLLGLATKLERGAHNSMSSNWSDNLIQWNAITSWTILGIDTGGCGPIIKQIWNQVMNWIMATVALRCAHIASIHSPFIAIASAFARFVSSPMVIYSYHLFFLVQPQFENEITLPVAICAPADARSLTSHYIHPCRAFRRATQWTIHQNEISE